MPPDRSSLAIGGCIKHKDGTAHIELKAFESTKSKGTAWAVDWIADRWPNTASVVIDSQSPAKVLLPDLKARHVKVITTGARDMGRACGRFLFFRLMVDSDGYVRICSQCGEPVELGLVIMEYPLD